MSNIASKSTASKTRLSSWTRPFDDEIDPVPLLCVKLETTNLYCPSSTLIPILTRISPCNGLKLINGLLLEALDNVWRTKPHVPICGLKALLKEVPSPSNPNPIYCAVPSCNRMPFWSIAEARPVVVCVNVELLPSVSLFNIPIIAVELLLTIDDHTPPFVCAGVATLAYVIVNRSSVTGFALGLPTWKTHDHV